jgi:FkbM family methyltransferase
MLIPLYYLVQKYNIQFKGILHVGAHECEEINKYLSYLPIDKMLWVEALPHKVELCKQRYQGVLIENAIVSDVVEKVKFNVSSNGESSSILEFGLHSTFHPHVTYIDSFEGETKLLKDVISKYPIEYNFLNFDIQGVELKALKGMEEYLCNVDYLYTEVNSDYVYKDCALVTELDDYLSKFGLERVETEWYGDCKWGDAFYIRKSPRENTPDTSVCITNMVMNGKVSNI